MSEASLPSVISGAQTPQPKAEKGKWKNRVSLTNSTIIMSSEIAKCQAKTG